MSVKYLLIKQCYKERKKISYIILWGVEHHGENAKHDLKKDFKFIHTWLKLIKWKRILVSESMWTRLFTTSTGYRLWYHIHVCVILVLNILLKQWRWVQTYKFYLKTKRDPWEFDIVIFLKYNMNRYVKNGQRNCLFNTSSNGIWLKKIKITYKRYISNLVSIWDGT